MSDWKDCTALEAHQAHVDGTHEYEGRYSDMGKWMPPGKENNPFYEDSQWQYRIREKMNTITVELPMPKKPFYFYIKNESDRWVAAFEYGSREQRDAAIKAMTAAMEKA